MKLSRRDFIKSIACAMVGFSITGFKAQEIEHNLPKIPPGYPEDMGEFPLRLCWGSHAPSRRGSVLIVDNFGGPTDTVEIPVFTKTIATDGTPLIWWHAQTASNSVRSRDV